MNELGAVVTVIAALIGLATVAGGLWAVFRGAADKATIERQRAEIGDYVQRLGFIEPRVKTLEEQNKLLLELHNPTETLAAMSAQSRLDHDQTVDLLNSQHAMLKQIEHELDGSNRDT